MAMSSTILALTLAMAAAQPATGQDELNDVYIGTIHIRKDAAVLARCDLGNTLYLLRDAAGHHRVRDLVQAHKPADQPIYGEVIASYQERDGTNILTVADIQSRKMGKDCHLTPPSLPVAEPTGDQAFTGHYYLAGVNEVGSELLLGADGRFSWMMAYGAVDNEAKGRWARQGDQIVLTADKPEHDKPLFALKQVTGWTEEAEEQIRDERRNALESKVHAACPFFAEDAAATATMMPIAGDKPTQAMLQARAAKALAEALAERGRLEALAQKVMALPDPSTQKEAAQTALFAWIAAHDAADNAALEARLPKPEIAEPKLPAACTLPSSDDAPPPVGGRAVLVDDGAGDGIRGVAVQMVLANGKREGMLTNRRGYGWLANDTEPGAVKALILKLGDHEQTIDVTPVDKGVIAVTVDVGQLTQPAFETMSLTIKGKDLLPGDASGSGRYTRTP